MKTSEKFYFTGIGSRSLNRQEHPRVWGVIKTVAAELAYYGILRSGGAEGADSAFELGCYLGGGEAEIYLPWDGFNGKYIDDEPAYRLMCTNLLEAEDIARDYHPNWSSLSPGAKLLMTRNTYQVLGADLQTPSSFVLCWTEGGKEIGGTSQALRIAKAYRIPILNLGAKDYTTQEILDWLSE